MVAQVAAAYAPRRCLVMERVDLKQSRGREWVTDCWRCDARGSVRKHGKRRRCNVCKGLGKVPLR